METRTNKGAQAMNKTQENITAIREAAAEAKGHARNVHEALKDALEALAGCDRCRAVVFLDDVALVDEDDGALVVCPRCAHEPPPLPGEPIAR
jgi:hypothetical protein